MNYHKTTIDPQRQSVKLSYEGFSSKAKRGCIHHT